MFQQHSSEAALLLLSQCMSNPVITLMFGFVPKLENIGWVKKL